MQYQIFDRWPFPIFVFVIQLYCYALQHNDNTFSKGSPIRLCHAVLKDKNVEFDYIRKA